MSVSPEILLIALNVIGTAGIWARLGSFGKGIAELERRMHVVEGWMHKHN